MRDPESDVVREVYAVVYAPKRAGRVRFPANLVEIMPDAAAACAAADPARHRHAARVAGPSVSSEGMRLYYLLTWLG